MTRGRIWTWMALLTALNGLDLFLTRHLVEQGSAYEANPLGANIVERFGWRGVSLFKAACVSTGLIIAVILAYRHPRSARRMLQISSGITGVVVGYSLVLVMLQRDSVRSYHETLRRAELLEDRRRAQLGYGETLGNLARQIALGKLTLEQATNDLADFCRGRKIRVVFTDAERMGRASLERYLAARLIYRVGMLLDQETAEHRARVRRLHEEFATRFHAPVPIFS